MIPACSATAGECGGRVRRESAAGECGGRVRRESAAGECGGTARRDRKPVSPWCGWHAAAVWPVLRAENCPVMRREGRGVVIAVTCPARVHSDWQATAITKDSPGA